MITEQKELWDSLDGKGFAAQYAKIADRASHDAEGNPINSNKVVFIEGTITESGSGTSTVYTVTCSTTYSEVATYLAQHLIPVCKFTRTKNNVTSTWYFYFHFNENPGSTSYTFGSVDNIVHSTDGIHGFISCVRVYPDNSWTFAEFMGYDYKKVDDLLSDKLAKADASISVDGLSGNRWYKVAETSFIGAYGNKSATFEVNYTDSDWKITTLLIDINIRSQNANKPYAVSMTAVATKVLAECDVRIVSRGAISSRKVEIWVKCGSSETRSSAFISERASGGYLYNTTSTFTYTSYSATAGQAEPTSDEPNNVYVYTPTIVSFDSTRAASWINSGIFDVARIPTTGSITSGDTTHVPTSQAVYDFVTDFKKPCYVAATNYCNGKIAKITWDGNVSCIPFKMKFAFDYGTNYHRFQCFELYGEINGTKESPDIRLWCDCVSADGSYQPTTSSVGWRNPYGEGIEIWASHVKAYDGAVVPNLSGAKFMMLEVCTPNTNNFHIDIDCSFGITWYPSTQNSKDCYILSTKTFLTTSDLANTIDSSTTNKAATPQAVYNWTGGYQTVVSPGGTPGSAANTLYFV